MKRKLFLLIGLIYSLFSFAHEVHFTLTNIDIKDGIIEIAVRISANDFAEMEFYKNLKMEDDHHHGHHHHHHYNEQKKALNAEEEQRLETYILEHLKLITNNKTTGLDLTKQNTEDGYYWYHFSANCPKNLGSLTIFNSLFIETFTHQQNLVSIKHKGNEHGVEFTVELTEKTIALE